MPDLIDEYIRCTRRCIDANLLPSFYDGHFRLLQPLLSLASEPILLGLVYSSRRHCELIEIDGDTFLIHDQYLGQTFNMLNRLVVEQRDPDQAMTYAHKVLAEQFRRRSSPLNALFCAVKYKESRHHLVASTMNIAMKTRFIIAQELFAMAHEVYHHLLKTDRALRANAIGLVRDFLSEHVVKYERRWSLEEALARVRAHPAAFHLVDPSEADVIRVAKEQVANFDNPVNQTLNARRAARSATAALEEEMMCDQLAAGYVAVVLSREQSMAVADTLQAVYLAHFHLRWLAHVEFTVNSYQARKGRAVSTAEFELATSDEYLDLQIRSHYMLLHCSTTAEILDGDKSLRDRLIEWQRLYYLHVYDPMTRVVGYLLHAARIGSELKRHGAGKRTGSRGEIEEIYRATDMLTGWHE